MPTFTFDEAEHAGLVRLLKEIIAADRFPMSARVKSLRAILAKMELPEAGPEPYPPLKPPASRAWLWRECAIRCGDAEAPR